jgi:glutamate synthase (NADPH/NADH) large chain
VIDACFAGHGQPLGGVGFDVLAAEVARRHTVPGPAAPTSGLATASSRPAGSTSGGVRASTHLFNPETVFKLQHATRTQASTRSSRSTRLVDDQPRS